MRDIRFGFFNTTYTVMWEYDDKTCFAYCGHQLFNKQLHAIAGYNENYTQYKYETIAEADITKNTITITVPKNDVGNPGMGDVLRNALIGSFLIPNQKKLLNLFPYASIFAYDEALDGRDYIIQY
jgi:hypothetical protein